MRNPGVFFSSTKSLMMGLHAAGAYVDVGSRNRRLTFSKCIFPESGGNVPQISLIIVD